MKIIKNIVFALCLATILSGGVVFAFGRGNPFSQNNNISDLMPTNVTIEGTEINFPIDVAPKAFFIFPKENQKVNKKIKIIMGVVGADRVEFYLSQGESPAPIYIGSGELRNKKWEYFWDTANTPNGEYSLFAQITNQHGTYKSEEIKIEVSNVLKESNASQQRRNQIENINSQIEEKDSLIENNISQATQNIIEDINTSIESINSSITNNATATATILNQEQDENQEIIKSGIQEIGQYIHQEIQLQSKIKKQKESKTKVEEKIKRGNKELGNLDKIQPIKAMEPKVEQIKKEKKQVIETHQKEKEKIDKNIQGQQQQLSKIIKERRLKQDELSNNAIKPIEIIQKQQQNSNIGSQIKEETLNKVRSKIDNIAQSLKEQEQSKKQLEEEASKDTDGDGLSDSLEVELGTDVLNPDSDGDGYLDGVEVAVKSDPLQVSTKRKLVYQDPRKISPKEEDTFSVERVESKVSEDSQKQVLVIEGKGLPNTFVTIYIYSLPIVVVTKTDSYGRWVYELDKPIDSGEHEVYVVLNNNQGEIMARSTGFNFIKSGASILQIAPDVWAKETPGGASKIASPYDNLQRGFVLLTLAIIILAISVALLTIGFLSNGKGKLHLFTKNKTKTLSKKKPAKKKVVRRKK